AHLLARRNAVARERSHAHIGLELVDDRRRHRSLGRLDHPCRQESCMSRVRFADFEADLASGELRRNGVQIPLQDLPFRLLAALTARPGVLVTRAELTLALWGTETFVDAAAGLNTAVAKLREALDDDAEEPKFIETVPKRGYRFVGHVESAD